MHCPSRAIAWRCGMKSHSRFVIRFTLAMVALFAFGNMVPSAAGATFRWDTISLTFPGGVPTVNTGGSDYALAADLTNIQISGHGTLGSGRQSDAFPRSAVVSLFRLRESIRRDPCPSSGPRPLTIGTQAFNGLPVNNIGSV